MSHFSEPLRLDDLGNRTFRLVLPLSYYLDNGEVIVVPEGFLTDFASVPRAFQNIIPPYGPYSKAAVIHDACYQTKGFYGKFTRKDSDKFFLEGMEVLGVNWITRHTMYRAVRTFSWYYWNKTREERLKTIAKKACLGTRNLLATPMPVVVP